MKLDLGFSLIGGPNNKDMKYIHITRSDVIKRITDHPSIDLWTRDYLISKIKDYPDNALIFFVQNINQIVISALNERTRILKEQYEQQRQEFSEGQVSVKSVEHEVSEESLRGTDEFESKQEEDDAERESLFAKRASD